MIVVCCCCCFVVGGGDSRLLLILVIVDPDVCQQTVRETNRSTRWSPLAGWPSSRSRRRGLGPRSPSARPRARCILPTQD